MFGFSLSTDKTLLDYLNSVPTERRTAAFDFDNTIVVGDLGETLLYDLAHKGKIPLSEEFLLSFINDKTKDKLLNANQNKLDKDHPLVQAHQNGDSYTSILELALAEYVIILEEFGGEIAYPWSAVLFSGHTSNEFKELSRKVITDPTYSQLQPSKIAGIDFTAGFKTGSAIRKLMLYLRLHGWQVKVITASPTELIREYFRLFDYGLDPAIDVVGMEIAPSAEAPDKLGSTVIPPMTYGPGKVTALKKMGVESVGFAAGDTWTDFDMLEFADQVLYVHRGDEKLLTHAQQNNWITVEQMELHTEVLF